MAHQFLFYSENIDREKGIITFDADESHHIVNVLRIIVGDEISATNGHGWHFDMRLEEADPKACKGIITSERQVETDAPVPVQIGIPCLKSDRWQMMVEIASEIGLSSIIPVDYEHSVAPWNASKLTKARRKAREALKQSGGYTLTQLYEAESLKSLLSRDDFPAIYYADPDGEPLSDVSPKSLFLIGPEADFSDAEKEQLTAMNALPYSLGQRRLRSEIAALLTVAHVQKQIQ